jgi:hypothetical protein
MFGPKMDEIIGDWRKLRNEKLHTLYSSLNIIIMMKSNGIRGVGHVARMGRREICTVFWWESRKERATRKT